MADSKNIQQEPCSTLLSDYELTTCDLVNSDETCEEVCQFLNVHRVSEGGGQTFEPDSSRELLRWLLCPPGYYEDWHLGVRDKSTKELIGFIGGVPVPMRVMGRDDDVPTAMIKCFCVHKLYGNDVASVMFAGMSERVKSKGVRQAMHAHAVHSEFNPPGVVICSCTTMIRNLNPETTLVDDELPDDPVTPGFIEMEKDDLKGVKDLLNDINSDKKIGLSWDDDTIKHMFLPKENDDLIHSYVVKDDRTSDITDFCSFYTTPLTVVENGEKTTMKCALSFYIGARATQLMNDMLIAAEQTDVDMFYASDMGEDENFWKELHFDEGLKCNYYIHNDANGIGISPLTLSEIGIGIVLW